MMSVFFGFSVDQTHMYMANITGFWKILNGVLFLSPAIAIQWEYRAKR